MDDSNIERRVRNDQREKQHKYEEKKKKLEAIKSSTFENRKTIKGLISLIPSSVLFGLTYVLASRGIFSPGVVPFVSVFGGQFIGDVIEMVVFDKNHKEYYDYYKERSEASKEGEVYSALETVENAKTDFFIAECENNSILKDGIKKCKNGKKSLRLKEYKENLQRELKQINSKIVLNENLSDYQNKNYAIFRHALKTVTWSLELCIELLFIQTIVTGGITTMGMFAPLFAGFVGYGSYNYSVCKARRKLYTRNSKRLLSTEYSDDLNELYKKQESLINKLGNICLEEEVERERKLMEKSESKNMVKKDIVKNNRYRYEPVEEETKDLDVSYGENSKARILRKKQTNG